MEVMEFAEGCLTGRAVRPPEAGGFATDIFLSKAAGSKQNPGSGFLEATTRLS